MYFTLLPASNCIQRTNVGTTVGNTNESSNGYTVLYRDWYRTKVGLYQRWYRLPRVGATLRRARYRSLDPLVVKLYRVVVARSAGVLRACIERGGRGERGQCHSQIENIYGANAEVCSWYVKVKLY